MARPFLAAIAPLGSEVGLVAAVGIAVGAAGWGVRVLWKYVRRMATDYVNSGEFD